MWRYLVTIIIIIIGPNSNLSTETAVKFWLIDQSIASQSLFTLSLKLHLATSELWFGQEQEGILPELLSSSGIV